MRALSSVMQFRKRSFFCFAVLSVGCAYPQPAPRTVAQAHDIVSLVDDLLTFHRAVLHDTVRIDACSIRRATGDSTILSRLSRQALNAVTTECEPSGVSFGRSRRSLLSLTSFPDSLIAEIEAVEGDYVHVASYRALPVAETPWFRFAEVTLSRFGHSVPPPPPPPQKK